MAQTDKIHKVPPTHIGIIMDGNGRWAKRQGIERSQGHLNGIQAVKDSLRVAIEYGVPFVTIYVFSTENWKRPKHEINFILDTVAGNLKQHYSFYKECDIKVIHSGNKNQLPNKVLDELQKVEEETKNNITLTLNLAFNHGGHDEIIRAIKKLMEDDKKDIENLDETTFRRYFDHPDLPDIDLLIRTGAQKRISNFMLWHCAYAELYFSDILWPDWNQNSMREAIDFFTSQERKFGGLTS